MTDAPPLAYGETRCASTALDHDLAEVIEFYPTREAAEAELAAILHDEPGWVTKLELVLADPDLVIAALR